MATQIDEVNGLSRGCWSTCWLRFVLAVTFLTRLPLPVRGEVRPVDLRASMGWHPVVGLGLGAVGWALYAAGCRLFPAAVTAVLVVILLEAFTGALHLDGLMDTCDGLGSGTPREQALGIMKDSRVGAMGVFGAIAVMALKIVALASLTPAWALAPLIVGWTSARVLPIWNVTLFPYARVSGTGSAFAEGKAPWAVVLASLVTLVIALAVGRLDGLLLALAAVVITLFVQAGIALKLRGLTGDVYGMGIELAETLALLIGTLFMTARG